jgi:hypothetical protein
MAHLLSGRAAWWGRVSLYAAAKPECTPPLLGISGATLFSRREPQIAVRRRNEVGRVELKVSGEAVEHLLGAGECHIWAHDGLKFEKVAQVHNPIEVNPHVVV